MAGKTLLPVRSTPDAGDARHGNAFDHLRLCAAFAVLLHHQFYAYQQPWFHEAVDLGAWAVGIFFAISGYLNGQSLLTRRSLSLFFASRGLRLYPALILCVAMSVLFGACVTTLSLRAYFGSGAWDYLWRNASLFAGQRASLPGVFEMQPVAVVNASLWTLPVEACFYIALALGLAALHFSRMAVGVAALVGLVILIAAPAVVPVNAQLIQIGTMFLTGLALAALESRFGRLRATLPAFALALLALGAGQEVLALSIVAAVMAVGIGNLPLPLICRLPADISYSFYLFAFPIQQIGVTLGLPFWHGLGFALVTTTIFATFSYFWVEQPALKLARRLKRLNPGGPAVSGSVETAVLQAAPLRR